MKELKLQLELLLQQSDNSELLNTLTYEKNIYPFSNEGNIMAFLLAADILTYEQYLQINREYGHRNRYLELFEMSPRTFGETWGENHILSLYPDFMKATKKSMANLYPSFDGEFDLWLEGIRVEVKACRANNTNSSGSLASRAYLHKEAADANFKYHFQQLKPSCCDIFIWIGVCRDDLIYWILTSEDLLHTGKLGSQHRNENTGTIGREVFEGQVFMTEEELKPFLVAVSNILTVVRKKIPNT